MFTFERYIGDMFASMLKSRQGKQCNIVKFIKAKVKAANPWISAVDGYYITQDLRRLIYITANL